MYESFFSIQATVAQLADVKFESSPPEVNYICFCYTHAGSILVFLPGYDEIITLRDNLTANREFGNTTVVFVCLNLTLKHSQTVPQIHTYTIFFLFLSDIRFVPYILPCNLQDKER